MKTVTIGLLGTKLDNRGKGQSRWKRWRPTLGLSQQQELKVDRFELLHETRDRNLAERTAADIQEVSPNTQVVLHPIRVRNPWDFEEVYGTLLDFCRDYSFKNNEEYLLHITTGTHVAQICWFLLCEANYLPAKLIQTSPSSAEEDTVNNSIGSYQIIDLDLSKYDAIAKRFERQTEDDLSFLKSGINTRNKAFNKMIEQLERVGSRSSAPVLITGPTGAGKSQLAKRLYELKKQKCLVQKQFVSINCATLRGDNAMSALFGHTKGAFTGAQTKRDGLLTKAHQGVLFLDEIGELGSDEQAMLLHAIEEKCFYPVGSDTTVQSDFQLIAGTNRNLYQESEAGNFRADLLARIDLWSYQLPGLAQRPEDIEPNIDYELSQQEKTKGHQVTFNQIARKTYLNFAKSVDGKWKGNFRDLNASIQRMTTLAEGGRITKADVDQEIATLNKRWEEHSTKADDINLTHYLDSQTIEALDLFDRIQLQQVINICRQSKSLSEAGRTLFDKSRLKKASTNDGHRLRQYLNKFDLSFNDFLDK